eukprot:5605886-Prymnesium_polylepis.1
MTWRGGPHPGSAPADGDSGASREAPAERGGAHASASPRQAPPGTGRRGFFPGGVGRERRRPRAPVEADFAAGPASRAAPYRGISRGATLGSHASGGP